MYRWLVAGIVYVALVVGGFTIYQEFFAEEKQAAHADGAQQGAHADGAQQSSHGNEQGHESAGEQAAGHGHDNGSESAHQEHGTAGASEVQTLIEANANELKITLKDMAGNPVDELEVNHEKLLHLIIVDQTLQRFVHVHPEKIGAGEFRIAHTLPEGVYKAFVDIKPSHLAYHVEPVLFTIGQPDAAAHQRLQPDQDLTRTVEGETVKLTMSSHQANQPVRLEFDLDQTHLTPYLGALGHVVILDEKAEDFLHVHPADEARPVFETQFSRPGTYKIWAEFQQNGKVRAFPFVVEIKE